MMPPSNQLGGYIVKRILRRRRMERRIVELFLQGKSNRDVCREFKIGDRKVRRIRGLADSYGYLSGERKLPVFPEATFPLDEPTEKLASSPVDEILLNKKSWIEERLAIGWRPVTIWEELDVTVKRSSFYRFLTRHNIHCMGERARLIPEIRHRSGEALLVDWGKLRSVVGEDGKRRILWAFVGVMGFSRYMMVRLVWTNDVPTTILSLESMLREVGGAPERLTSDNPKCFAIEASKYEPLLNPVLERWSAHFGLTLECLPPSDPQKKGKVERLMPFVRRLYEAHGDAWLGLEESQNYINKKVAIANQRKHGTTGLKPTEVLEGVERAELKALPAVGYEMEEFHEGEVRKDGYVRFRNKYYSVGEEHAGLSVVILGNKTHVSIYAKGKLIEVHDRITDAHSAKSTKEHHLKPHERTLEDGAFYIKRAEKLGSNVGKVVTLILGSGDGFVDTRKVWGILSLDKNFAAAAIDRACELALEMNSISYRTVNSLVRMQPRVTNAAPDGGATAALETNQNIEDGPRKFVRSLDEYKQFLASEGRGGTNEPTNVIPTI
jgi:transposase